jgi:hypothetical protein
MTPSIPLSPSQGGEGGGGGDVNLLIAFVLVSPSGMVEPPRLEAKQSFV